MYERRSTGWRFVVKLANFSQLTGKPNHKISPFPLIQVPLIKELFSVVQVDVIGSSSRTPRGNEYIFTIIYVTTRYLHAVSLRKITAKAIVKALDFSHFGLPYRVQSDGASYFVGKVFKEAMAELDIGHNVSSPYHPQTQGAVERSHQTLKGILRYALQYSLLGMMV